MDSTFWDVSEYSIHRDSSYFRHCKSNPFQILYCKNLIVFPASKLPIISSDWSI